MIHQTHTQPENKRRKALVSTGRGVVGRRVTLPPPGAGLVR